MKKLLVLFVGLLLLLTNQYLNAQSLAPLNELVNTATEVFNNEGEDEGLKYFEAAMQKALEEDATVVYLDLIAGLAYAYIDFVGDDIKTVNAFERAYHLPFEPSCKEEFEALTSIYIYLGYTYSKSIGDFSAAIKPYKKAVDIFENQLEEASVYRALNLEKYIGNIYTRQGDYEVAEVHLKYALDVLLDNEEFDEAAFITNDLGLLYQTWDKYDLAEKIYQKGFSLPSKFNVTKIYLLINYSSYLIERGFDNEALEALEEVDRLVLLNKEDEDFEYWKLEYQGASFEKKARIKMMRGDYKAAYKDIESSINSYRNLFGTEKRREVAKLYIVAADILLKMGDLEGAIQVNQKALSCVLHQYNPKTTKELPLANTFFAENSIMESLGGMIEVYTSWFDKTKDEAYLKQALRCHELIYEAEGELRRSYIYENSKLFSLEEGQQRIEEAISLAYQLYEITNENSYLYQAFTFAERNRSSLLREALRSSKAINELGLNAEELEQEKELAYQVSKAQDTWFDLQGEETPDSLLQAANKVLLNAKDAQKKWIEALEAKHPRYYQLKYNDALPRLETYQAMLQSGQLMLEYFIGKEHLYVFAIDEKGIELHQLDLPKNLTQKVLLWRKSIVDYQYPMIDKTQLMIDYRQLGYELYEELLQNVLAAHKGYDHLLIVPSGILDLLPFEALLHEKVATTTTLKQYPYLLNDFTVSYAYSATLYHSLLQMERKGEGLGAFAPSFADSEEWPTLSCGANLFKNLKTPWRKDTWLDKEATTQRFREMAGKYQVLHLATHAQANAEFGDFSFILLHNEQGGFDSLFAKDLYLLDINAELVILSACETALGTLYDSEGVISLARAFHYAGARSVLTTLWRINEGANCQLMEHFYDELANNPAKPLALQKAKQRYIENVNTHDAHPVYWAGFQFSGNPRPVDEPSNFVWYVLGGFLLVFFGFLFKNKGKKKVEVNTGQLVVLS